MLSSLTGALDRRFLFSAVLPAALFLLLSAFIGLADADPDRAAALWDEAAALHLIVLAAATGLLAVLISAAAPLLTRLAEGYWSTPAGRLIAQWGRRHHQRRLSRLAADPAGYRVIHLRYPLASQPGEVMPTRFGNILRSAELYPRDRYGIDTALTWPRLYQVLPERQVTQIASARGDIDLLLATSALATVLAVAGGGWLLAAGEVWWRFLLCFWGGVAVAWFAYAGALASAVTYGQHIRTAFDIHRGNLLERLGLADEPDVWRSLAQHWYRNIPLDADLEPDVPDEPQGGTGPAVPLGRLALTLVLAAGIAGVVALV